METYSKARMGFSGCTTSVWRCLVMHTECGIGMGSKDPVWNGKPPEYRLERLLLAKSKDGQNWTKPELNLVDYNGSKANNIVLLNQEGVDFMAAAVIFYEESEEDPAKKFKMLWESQGMNPKAIKCNIVQSFSPDGLTWTVEQRPEISMEMSGGIILEPGLDGTPKRYLVSGHGGSHYPSCRRMILYESYDFESWTDTTVSGFCRTPWEGLPQSGGATLASAGEQCHLGAGLKQYPGLVLGMYGMWHGSISNDRRLTTMDLGLVISNDGLHYREPIKDFRMIPCAEDCSTIVEIPWSGLGLLTPTIVDHPANVQGNGMENVGDYTLFWYGKWPEVNADGVRCAKWPRDRLGYLATDPSIKGTPTVISCPIDLQGKQVKISLNVDGVSHTQGSATVEMLTEQFKPIPGFSGENAMPINTSGLRVPVLFGTADSSARAFHTTSGRVRVQVTLSGNRPEDVKLYALYVDLASIEDSIIPGLYLPPAEENSLSNASEAGSVWKDEWELLVEELHEMGFEDRNLNRIAVAKNNGELKGTVATLIHAEREHR